METAKVILIGIGVCAVVSFAAYQITTLLLEWIVGRERRLGNGVG